MVTITWEITSGGVMTAAKIKMTTIACLRYLIRKSGVNKPILTHPTRNLLYMYQFNKPPYFHFPIWGAPDDNDDDDDAEYDDNDGDDDVDNDEGEMLMREYAGDDGDADDADGADDI